MKKILALMLALLLVLALSACGEKPAPAAQNTPAPAAPADTGTSDPAPAAPADTEEPAAAPQSDPGQASAADGTLTLSASGVAVVVNGTSVPMPYNLMALEAAGVPADADRAAITLGAGDFFSANLYLDENEDYLLIPAYYNGGDASVTLAEAEAEEITMTTYADAPVDQGVSILGVSFGMAKSDVIALLGAPMSDNGSYCEWHVEVTDIAYEGTLSMYFTDDSDAAGVSQVDLTVFPK